LTPRTQEERTRATTGQLLDASKRLFAAEGYAATSLETVAEEAGVTKGALYHHFKGKRELFAAVYDHEQRRLAALIDDAYRRKRDPWAGFYSGCRAFFEASLDRDVQRITLLDAPGAIGWEAMREIENQYSLKLLKNGLSEAIEAGRIAKRPVDPLAHLLLGAMCEGAMMAARADDPALATRRCLAELKSLLDALAL